MNPTTDRFTIRCVVVGLIVVTLGIVVSMLAILVTVNLTAEQQTSVITTLSTIGTAALGGVVGLLAHTASADPPVAGQPGEPVQVPVIGGNLQVGPVPDPPPAPPVAAPEPPLPPVEVPPAV